MLLLHSVTVSDMVLALFEMSDRWKKALDLEKQKRLQLKLRHRHMDAVMHDAHNLGHYFHSEERAQFKPPQMAAIPPSTTNVHGSGSRRPSAVSQFHDNESHHIQNLHSLNHSHSHSHAHAHALTAGHGDGLDFTGAHMDSARRQSNFHAHSMAHLSHNLSELGAVRHPKEHIILHVHHSSEHHEQGSPLPVKVLAPHVPHTSGIPSSHSVTTPLMKRVVANV
jgi:hypothetical protein